MAISESDGPLTTALNKFKAKKKADTHRRAERKGVRRGWLRDKHADIHSGVATEAYRENYNLIDWGHGAKTRTSLSQPDPSASGEAAADAGDIYPAGGATRGP